MTLNRNALKLALLYLTILASICFVFSVAFYNTSLREVEHGLTRNPQPGLKIGREIQIIDREIRERVLDDLRSSLVIRLIVVNAILLSFGGILSYLFALQTLKPIEESKEKLEQFTADAAHDLRTPLSAMKIENEIFLDNSENKLGEAKAQIQSNLEEVDRLINLTEGLLTLSVQANSLNKGEVSLNEVISSVVKTSESIALKKSIQINVDIEDLGVVRGNQQLIERAVLALVDNAIKYSDEKSQVDIRGFKRADHQVIEIKDYGKGIGRKDIDRIFDRFYRADDSRKKDGQSGGHGLGLAIAKEIIENHKGTLTVTSKKSEGTTFTVIL
ncbi:MAG: HAMP domain-containing sensor histidine kinase [Patescibacteria group bacterium]